MRYRERHGARGFFPPGFCAGGREVTTQAEKGGSVNEFVVVFRHVEGAGGDVDGVVADAFEVADGE